MSATDKGAYVGDEVARILRAGVALAKKDATRFNMDFWVYCISSGLKYERTQSFLDLHSDCGTTLCFASFLLELAPPEFFIGRELTYVSVDAAEFAGLSSPWALRLFFVMEWPIVYRKAYEKAKTPEQLVDALERRVEHFIRTGE